MKFTQREAKIAQLQNELQPRDATVTQMILSIVRVTSIKCECVLVNPAVNIMALDCAPHQDLAIKLSITLLHLIKKIVESAKRLYL
jgi:hypothetical protein